MTEFEFVPDGPLSPVVVEPNKPHVLMIALAGNGHEQKALPPPEGETGPDPDGADWQGAKTVDWEKDPVRRRFHALGVEAWKTGNRSIWIACGCAWRIVGHYARGATQAFATDISRSVDTVENMAHAADLYTRLQKEFGTFRDTSGEFIYRPLLPRLREVRRKLYYTHFSEMWSLWRADPSLTALAIFADLETAAANGISSRTLKAEGANAGGGGGAEPVVLAVHGLRSSYIKDLAEKAHDHPADTYVVILSGPEWVGVSQVKVKPA